MKSFCSTPLDTRYFAAGLSLAIEPAGEIYEKLTERFKEKILHNIQKKAFLTRTTEAVRVVFDPAKVSYEKLLEVFWRNIDPTVTDRQFVDVGSQYRAAVFYHDEAQRAAAEASKEALGATGRFDKPIVTGIVPVSVFYPAEGYHQDYYKKNPIRYKYYRWGSGRDQFLEKVWGEDG